MSGDGKKESALGFNIADIAPGLVTWLREDSGWGAWAEKLANFLEKAFGGTAKNTSAAKTTTKTDKTTTTESTTSANPNVNEAEKTVIASINSLFNKVGSGEDADLVKKGLTATRISIEKGEDNVTQAQLDQETAKEENQVEMKNPTAAGIREAIADIAGIAKTNQQSAGMLVNLDKATKLGG